MSEDDTAPNAEACPHCGRTVVALADCEPPPLEELHRHRVFRENCVVMGTFWRWCPRTGVFTVNLGDGKV